MKILKSQAEFKFISTINIVDPVSINIFDFLNNHHERFEFHDNFIDLINQALENGSGIVNLEQGDEVNLYSQESGFESVVIQNCQDELIHLDSIHGRLELLKRLALLITIISAQDLKNNLCIGWVQAKDNYGLLFYGITVFKRKQDKKLVFHASSIKPFRKTKIDFLSRKKL